MGSLKSKRGFERSERSKEKDFPVPVCALKRTSFGDRIAGIRDC